MRERERKGEKQTDRQTEREREREAHAANSSFSRLSRCSFTFYF